MRWIVLDARQEVEVGQDTLQGYPNPRVEARLFAAGLVERQQRRQILVRNRPAIRTPGER